jgi:hypothetical protein
MPQPADWQVTVRLPDIIRTGNGADIERYAVYRVHVAEGQAIGALLPHR